MSNNQVAVQKQKQIDVVDEVAKRVRTFETRGELTFPENYIPENALKSAYLVLQETTDRDKKPVLKTCSNASIANSLLSMVVQGLNPDKQQCYFIAYGNKLVLQRSYFGAMHVAKTVDPNIEDIYAAAVYEDDDFEYEIKHGKERVIKHTQKLANKDKDKIIGAYATILYKDGKELSTVMTMDQIKQAWSKSSMKPVDDKGNIKPFSTHGQFTEEMAKKTVINRACKYVINSSSDTNIITKFAKELDIDIAEAETEAIIEENANQEYLDFDEDTGEIIDMEDDEIEEESEVVEEEQIEMEGPGY
ncbi:recombinase RecT [Tissierella praeacuta]|uniref:recombinase RecT n=1 Tax=Tissierella praeacuta TaxID=43131 RepID=UPI003DA36FDB